jgi:SAM-dependent methyltransferase
VTTLAAQRDIERNKYIALAAKGGTYGSTNHGKGAYRLVMREACANLNSRPNIVDFGCGRNNWKRQLEAPYSVLGIDFAFPEADIQRPMHDTGLPDGWADVVTSFDALEHLLPDEVDDVLREMRRVATPGGSYVFSIATRPSKARGVNGEELHMTIRPLEWWLAKLPGARVERGYIVGKWE